MKNGLFSKPTQHEVIHTLYRAGADFYFNNIYNGNKLNLKVKQEEVLQKIKEIRKTRAFPIFITKQLHCISIFRKV